MTPPSDHLLSAPQRGRIAEGNALVDAMHQEPSGFHAAIERPLNLSSADALLALANKVDRLQPKMQREMAVLEDRADPHGKGLAAGVALAEARAARLALKASNPCRIDVAAMRAN